MIRAAATAEKISHRPLQGSSRPRTRSAAATGRADHRGDRGGQRAEKARQPITRPTAPAAPAPAAPTHSRSEKKRSRAQAETTPAQQEHPPRIEAATQGAAEAGRPHAKPRSSTTDHSSGENAQKPPQAQPAARDHQRRRHKLKRRDYLSRGSRRQSRSGHDLPSILNRSRRSTRGGRDQPATKPRRDKERRRHRGGSRRAEAKPRRQQASTRSK